MLRGELRELGEEPVTVLKEAVLMDGIEGVPVLISFTVKLLCSKEAKSPQNTTVVLMKAML